MIDSIQIWFFLYYFLISDIFYKIDRFFIITNNFYIFSKLPWFCTFLVLINLLFSIKVSKDKNEFFFPSRSVYVLNASLYFSALIHVSILKFNTGENIIPHLPTFYIHSSMRPQRTYNMFSKEKCLINQHYEIWTSSYAYCQLFRKWQHIDSLIENIFTVPKSACNLIFVTVYDLCWPSIWHYGMCIGEAVVLMSKLANRVCDFAESSKNSREAWF